jgi:uroporphyrinogen-III synthase
MPENKIHILSTRPLPDQLIQEAAAEGIDVEVASFIRTNRVQTEAVFVEIDRAFSRKATVIFTSMNAVDAVAACQKDPQPDWRIYCIGYQTGELVKSFFGEERIAGTASSAKDLATQIIRQQERGDLIFFCGDRRRDELPGLLKQNGIALQEIVVYETHTMPHPAEKNYAGILFFSPSAAESFFSGNKVPGETVLFAIGQSTAAEIRKYSDNRLVAGDEPGKEKLLRKAIAYFRQAQ